MAAMAKSVSLPELKGRMGKSATAWPGSLPLNAIDGSLGPARIVDGKPLETLGDLIRLRSKGGVGPPYATRQRPIAGLDAADRGGAYASHASMMQHRTRHVRTVNGPNERFGHAGCPPISSYQHGFGAQNLRPPLHPISSTWISRTASEIQKVVGAKGGR
mmetsp:Transcript_98001/g.299580  ORF Transcript_98001/g.299580 Transcript_98001/m.299580 type:complete len:160 (-) Transcript_98001:52-531(-)